MSQFFKAPQAAAILKHGILRRYLPVFATKTGSRAGEVVYLDGYAGPGLYDDGSPGSPALALTTAKAIGGYRGRASMHGHLIEYDESSVEALRALLSNVGATWDVHQGRAEEVLPAVLDGLQAEAPLFAFIDPFGLPIPFDQASRILQRGGRRATYGRVNGAPTELLLNFSIPGINRVGGQLTGQGTDPRWMKARDTMVERMDAVLGGDWWHAIWESGSTDRVDRIRQEYKQRLRDSATGWAVFDIDVADRWQGPPSYHLLLFTQHPDGVWAFTECLSSASEEYRAYCHEHEGLLDLEPLADREAIWVSTIEANVRGILADGKPFQPVRRLLDVYGSTFGEARQKHLRKALKQLYKEGVISTDCVGVNDLAGLVIRPA